MSAGSNSGKDGKSLNHIGSYTGSKVTLGVYVSSSACVEDLSGSGANSRGGGGLSSTSRHRKTSSIQVVQVEEVPAMGEVEVLAMVEVVEALAMV